MCRRMHAIPAFHSYFGETLKCSEIIAGVIGVGPVHVSVCAAVQCHMARASSNCWDLSAFYQGMYMHV
jgi:hypothetical protein